mgnify:CR=1 FL=1
MAYADLSSYGSEFIDTPNLDKMADDGVKMTSYYAPQAVCSASRAAILTGCYPNRLGISGAFGPKSKRGINPNELLLSEMLQSNNILSVWDIDFVYFFLLIDAIDQKLYFLQY